MFTDTSIVWQVQVVHRAGERFDDSLLLTRARWREYADEIARLAIERAGHLKVCTMDDFGYFPITPEFKLTSVSPWDGCPAGRYVVGIRANGDVLACLSLGSDFVEDNVRKRPLVEIWRDPDMFPKFRNKQTVLSGACAKCPKAAECRAGCSAAALSTTGKLTENLFCVRQLETERIINSVVQ
jgi:radical SAM protein with 4Fe4S-binding SPASM domain